MAVDNIARGLAASALKKGGVTTEQLEEGLAKKLDKAGGTVTGDLAIQGDLTVAGTTKSEKTKTLMVEDNVIVTNANKVALQALLSGLAINKDANATYGIMYDPADDTVKFGQGVLDKGGKFTFSEGEGKPLAIRAQSTELNEGHLIKWDSTTNSFIDSGKIVTDFVEVQDVKDMISEAIVQETGEATDKVMSQKTVTDSLNNKINYTDIDNGLTVVDGKVKANITKIQDSTSTEFTPDENGVVTIPTGSANNSGLMRLVNGSGQHGLQMWGGGAIAIHPAEKTLIDKRSADIGSGNLSPIISSDINYAVKAALTDEKRIGTETTDPTTFSDTEKDRACEILGAVRKVYRHYTTFHAPVYGSCKLSFISLKPNAYSSAENLSELKDAVSVEYCTIGDSSYLIGTLFINPNDGDYTLRTAEHLIVIYTVTSFTDTVTEL